MNEELDRLTKRMNPKERKITDKIQRLQYKKQQKKQQVKKNKLRLEELKRTAGEEKALALERAEMKVENASSKFNDQKKRIQEQKQKWKDQQQKQDAVANKKTRRLEKEKKEKLKEIHLRFKTEFQRTEKQEERLNQQQMEKLKAAGADTQRLKELDDHLKKINGELQFIEENRELVIEYRKDKREFIDRIDEFKRDQKNEDQKLERAKNKLESVKKQHREELDQMEKAVQEFNERIRKLEEGLQEFEHFSKSEIFKEIENQLQPEGETGDAYSVKKTVQELREISFQLNTFNEKIRDDTNRFLNNFSDANLFKFRTQPGTFEENLRFASNLKEFIDQNKITEFKDRVNSRFADILRLVSKETDDLVSREGDIQKVTSSINRDFRQRNFVGVIQSMELKVEDSSNRVVNTLKRIREFDQERGHTLGGKNLFNYESREEHNQKAVDFLRQLTRDIQKSKTEKISLSDAFELRFRVVENENDSGWVEKLSNVGSEGTDVLVKAMINILLLNVFKESASRKNKDFRLHCMMDEVGRLHPTNVRGILKFANDRNIMLINGSPVEQDAMAYRHIYELRKDSQSQTRIKRLITVK